MFHLIVGRQKLTQVLKVTLLQIFLFLRVCVCIKKYGKSFNKRPRRVNSFRNFNNRFLYSKTRKS